LQALEYLDSKTCLLKETSDTDQQTERKYTNGVIVYGIIQGILVKQISSAGSLSEKVTKDCDGDGKLGLTDDCPCDPDKQKLEEGEICSSSDTAKTNCPSLCKND